MSELVNMTSLRQAMVLSQVLFFKINFFLENLQELFLEDIPIKKFTTHESFSTSSLQNDIAVIELEKPVTFRVGLRPACLPDQFKGFDLNNLQNQPVIVGWGSTTTEGTTVAALRQVKNFIIFLWSIFNMISL